MTEVFLTALEKLTDPLAIIAVVLMFTNAFMLMAILRHLPRLYETLGKQAAILEHLVYNKSQEE